MSGSLSIALTDASVTSWVEYTWEINPYLKRAFFAINEYYVKVYTSKYYTDRCYYKMNTLIIIMINALVSSCQK